MMSSWARFLYVMFLLCPTLFLVGQPNGIDTSPLPLSPSFVVMRPTGDFHEGLPVMTLIPNSTPEYQQVFDLMDSSFAGTAVEFYNYANHYVKLHEPDHLIEPAYLALTDNDGGFAKSGFYLRSTDGLLEKRNTPYIDIVENRIFQDPGRLMSITQLYPHEMGHVLFHLLGSRPAHVESRSVDMHYFSVTTDFHIAFDEGFAEHMENLSRLHEPDRVTRAKILDHAIVVRKKSAAAIRGFDLDQRWFLRMGYYKMTTLLWYQQYENLKRFDFAVDAISRFPGAYPEHLDLEDKMFYRNAALFPDSTYTINYSRALATEGAINAFFTDLSNGEAGKHFLDPSFYNAFTGESDSSSYNPEDRFQPWENQLLKYFTVFYQDMRGNSRTGCDLIDFVEGYLNSFPEEEPFLRKAFERATGHTYQPDIPEPHWLMVQGSPHRFIVPDAYGSMQVPLYTFNLHAADALDLQTIPGVNREKAEWILAWRDLKGENLVNKGVGSETDISEGIQELLSKYAFDQSKFDQVEFPEIRFQTLIWTPVWHFLGRIFIGFLVFYLSFQWLARRITGSSMKKGMTFGLSMKWVLLVLAGLLFTLSTIQAWVPFLGLVGILLVLDILVFRKSKQKIYLAMSGTLAMCCLLLPSLI